MITVSQFASLASIYSVLYSSVPSSNPAIENDLQFIPFFWHHISRPISTERLTRKTPSPTLKKHSRPFPGIWATFANCRIAYTLHRGDSYPRPPLAVKWKQKPFSRNDWICRGPLNAFCQNKQFWESRHDLILLYCLSTGASNQACVNYAPL